MSGLPDSGYGESDETSAPFSSDGEPDHASEQEGYEEGDALSEEMGEFVEENVQRDLDDDRPHPFASSHLDATDEEPAAPAVSQSTVTDSLSAAIARALNASQFNRFVNRVAALVGRQIERATDTIGKSRLRTIQSLLQTHAGDTNALGVLDALSRWYASTGAAEALPVMAGMVAWTVLHGCGNAITLPVPVEARNALLAAAVSACMNVVEQYGHAGIRALARIGLSVARVARRRKTLASQLPAALSDSVAHITSQPGLLRRLASRERIAPLCPGAFASQAGIQRHFMLDGPVSITVVRDATGF